MPARKIVNDIPGGCDKNCEMNGRWMPFLAFSSLHANSGIKKRKLICLQGKGVEQYQLWFCTMSRKDF